MIVETPRERTARNILVGVGVVVLMTWSLAPIYWVLATAFKSAKEIYALPPTFFPQAPTLENFRTALFETAFPVYIWNSAVVAVTVTVISAVVGALTAYPLARMEFQGRSISARLLIMSYLLPPSLLFIPLFLVLQNFGLIDTRFGLSLAYLTFTVPFCTWMLLGYFRTLPGELDEAALVDGAGRGRILVEILMPLALPGLVVVALFAFTHAWNEFLYALVYVYSRDTQTFTAGLSSLVMGDTFIWGQLMASSVIAIVPILLIYIFAQKFIVEGLAAGSVKG